MMQKNILKIHNFGQNFYVAKFPFHKFSGKFANLGDIFQGWKLLKVHKSLNLLNWHFWPIFREIVPNKIYNILCCTYYVQYN